jgi:methylated-DNA-[protein]-cysteine S-methyltransferase
VVSGRWLNGLWNAQLLMKENLRELLVNQQFDQVAEIAARRKRVLGSLIALTYDADPLIGWRAVEALGWAARRIAEDDADCVREHLRRLYWLISEESGGICWHAPEAMAEIIRHRPIRFADYVPVVVSIVQSMAEEDLAHFRAGALWAIGRLGPLAVAHLPLVLPAITNALDSPDPQVRGMAVWCLGAVGQPDRLSRRADLRTDDGPVELYEDGHLRATRVGDLLERALGEGR